MPNFSPFAIVLALASATFAAAAYGPAGPPQDATTTPAPTEAEQRAARQQAILEALDAIERRALEAARRAPTAEVLEATAAIRAEVARLRQALDRRDPATRPPPDGGTRPPPTRPPPVDPGTRPPPTDPGTRPPPVDPPPVGEAWPDGLPFSPPPIPTYAVPTLADCEWVVQGGAFVSQRGLGQAPNVNEAYRASLAAGHALPITFGVWDSMGSVVAGGIYNGDAPQSVTARDSAGNWRTDISLEIVGLDDTCDVVIGWTDDFGKVARLALFNIGLRGPQDSFYVRANDGIGTAIFDGCWFAGGSAPAYTSGIHMDRWATLVLRNWRFKGALLAEHLFYLKSCVGSSSAGGGTWIVGNNLLGGNRTGFQVRPEFPQNPTPSGPVVIAYNVADGYGWTHGTDPATKGGGSCLTVWTNPNEETYVFGNTVTNARYGCFVLSGQGAGTNYLNADGFPIRGVHVFGNRFENNGGDRTCISLSACQRLDVHGENTMDGPGAGDVVFDDVFNWQWNGITNGAVALHGQAVLDYLKGLNVMTYDPANPNKNRPLDDSVLDGWLVP